MTAILFIGTYNTKEFYSFKVLKDGTKISAITCTGGYNVLSTLGITNTTELKKGTVIKTPIQFPFNSITTTAGAVNITPVDFTALPTPVLDFTTRVLADSGTVEPGNCLQSLINQLSI